MMDQVLGANDSSRVLSVLTNLGGFSICFIPIFRGHLVKDLEFSFFRGKDKNPAACYLFLNESQLQA